MKINGCNVEFTTNDFHELELEFIEYIKTKYGDGGDEIICPRLTSGTKELSQRERDFNLLNIILMKHGIKEIEKEVLDMIVPTSLIRYLIYQTMPK